MAKLTLINIIGSLLVITLVIYLFNVFIIIDGFNTTQTAPKTCPSLSPAAAAAAAAADAQDVADKAKVADIAAVASKAVSDNLLPQMTALKGINIQCSNGEPIISTNNSRNTKFVPNNNYDSCDTQSNSCEY
jgi:Flp pilus assembly protein TadG